MSEVRADAAPEDRAREVEAVLGRRIQRLELENARMGRRLRFIAVASGAALAASLALLLIVGARLDRARERVEAREFVLRDERGTVRATLGGSENGGWGLRLRDADGAERSRLVLLPDGSPGLTLADRAGRTRAVLALDPAGATHLVFGDRQGRTRTVLGLEPDRSSRLVFVDTQGQVRAAVGVDGAERPEMNVMRDAPAVSEPPPPPADSAALPGAAAPPAAPR